MARHAAFVVSWSGTVPGREGKALEAFTDFLTYWAKRATDGKNQEAEPFFASDGRRGFAIIRGPSDSLMDALESEEYERILTKAQLTVQELNTDLYYTGDEEVQRAISIFGETAGELGYL